MNGMLFTPTNPLVNRGGEVLFSSSSFLYWSFSIKVLFSFLTLAYFAPLYDFLGLVDLLIWFPQMLVLTNNMKCWYNFYQYLFQLLVWWATYLCLEWGSDASFAFFRVNTPSFFMPGGTFLSIILCFLQFFAPPTLLELKWVHCQRSVACRIFCFCFSAFSTASICFSLSSPHTHFWDILGLVTMSTWIHLTLGRFKFSISCNNSQKTLTF